MHKLPPLTRASTSQHMYDASHPVTQPPLADQGSLLPAITPALQWQPPPPISCEIIQPPSRMNNVARQHLILTVHHTERRMMKGIELHARRSPVG
jgi:hypothetical protein